MDPEDFIRWALDDARTLEERYTTELFVEEAEMSWNVIHKTGRFTPWQEIGERDRQRFLNPAYQPEYSEQSVRRAAETIPLRTQWSIRPGYNQRPVRDIAVLRFLTALEKLDLACDVADISLLAELPALRELSIGTPPCEDFRPLALCTGLRSLALSFTLPWPDLAGLEKLQQLQSLSLAGNLLAFERGIVFPLVRSGTLNCSPLSARNVRYLPLLPACEFLALGGVYRLEGIENFPRLRNLSLTGPVRDFAPLAALSELTSFHYTGGLPLDVAPLARPPKLLRASFTTQHVYNMEKAPLRDYGPITASSTLRELVVTGCPPLEMEVAALNATLPPWDDLLLAASPRPVPALRMIIGPQNLHPQRKEPHCGPEEPDLPDTAIRDCEGRWVKKFAQKHITERIGNPDWGRVDANGVYRSIIVWVECYEVVERLPEIVDATREAMARLRHGYMARLYIALRVPPQKPTPVQVEMLKRYEEEVERADFERSQTELRDRLEKTYLYELKKQEGEDIDPDEFAPEEREPLPPAPWEEEQDVGDDDNTGEGGIAVKEKPDPPPDPWDNEHPLAGNYRLCADITLEEIWFDPRQDGLAIHLMGRKADTFIPQKPEAGNT